MAIPAVIVPRPMLALADAWKLLVRPLLPDENPLAQVLAVGLAQRKLVETF